MQIRKGDIENVFAKLNLELRETGHIYGWLVVEGKKILNGNVIIPLPGI